MEGHASIPVTVICLSGLLMIFAGLMFYTFIGPHPDASGSVQENPLNPLFWSDHPGIASIGVGLILWTVGYTIDRRSHTRRSSKVSGPLPDHAGEECELRSWGSELREHTAAAQGAIVTSTRSSPALPARPDDRGRGGASDC